MSDRVILQERLAGWLQHPVLSRPAYVALKFLGVEIPRSIRGYTGMKLPHGAVGLVIHPATVIGNNVRFSPGVIIGRADTYLERTQAPQGGGVVLEDDVILGPGAKVLFRAGQTITVGRGSVIGANSVLTKSVPAGEIWSGLPCVKLRELSADELVSAATP